VKLLFNWITVISGWIVILMVLLQSQGASLGISFGGESNYYRSKRGTERVIFNATIIFAVIFVLSVILSLLAKK
jgi:preprotein translocase subunit SecG